MKRALGPLDKRKRVSRCQPCALRRIKCSGGSPCNYCKRTGKSCQPQSERSPQVITFVSVVPDVGHDPIRVVQGSVPKQVQPDRGELYFDHFASRMQRSQFTRDFQNVALDLLPLIHSSSSLHDITLAIGALDTSQRCSVRSSHGRDSPKSTAFHLYGKSIQTLQMRLENLGSGPDEDLLWVTFFLGLFELMSKQSTETWSMHMVVGMGKLVQLLAPLGRLSPVTRKLLGVHRYLEVSRAILYGTETVFSREQLQEFSEGANQGDISQSLLLMQQSSHFFHRFFRDIENIPPKSRNSSQQIIDLSKEGLRLHQQLLQNSHQDRMNMAREDAYEKLAATNYCANLLFVCRNFTFYNCWGSTEIPILTMDEMEKLAANILDISGELLENSNIPGILLLFPLRMAGAAASGSLQRSRVVAVLDRVYEHGFAIAGWIRNDLKVLWKWQDSVGQKDIMS